MSAPRSSSSKSLAAAAPAAKPEAVHHPAHYNAHPSGVECIDVVEHMGFNLGNAVKYIWRADLKHGDATPDLNKAIWLINREIKRRARGVVPPRPAGRRPGD